MKKLFQIIILISMGLSFNSCYYDAFPEEEILPPIDDEVSYKADIMPLWVQCVGCHNGTLPPDLRDEFSYDSLLNGVVVPNDSEASILYKSLLELDGVSLMPPGSKWPASKISLVKAWIDQGAKDN
jgi:hypothetical protein